MPVRVYYRPEDGAVSFTCITASEGEQPIGSLPYIDVSEEPPNIRGYKVENNQLVLVSVAPAIEEAVSRINRDCGRIRARFVTQIPGQEMLYVYKENEAKSYLTDPAPDPVNYPLLASEVPATASSLYEVAQVYLNMAMQWRQIGGSLENLRLGAVAAAQMAVTPEEVDQVLVNFKAAYEQFLQALG